MMTTEGEFLLCDLILFQVSHFSLPVYLVPTPFFSNFKCFKTFRNRSRVKCSNVNIPVGKILNNEGESNTPRHQSKTPVRLTSCPSPKDFVVAFCHGFS